MTTRIGYEAALDRARKYFSDDPWWLEAMVKRILASATEAEFMETLENTRVSVSSIPERNDMDPVYAMLERMHGGEVPTVAPDRTMWHYVTVEQDWTIRFTDDEGDWTTVNFHGTRENAERHVRDLSYERLAMVVEEW